MYYVYLIQSIKYPEKKYIGYTRNLKERLKTHNCAGFKHTTRYRPWKVVMYLAFEDLDRAVSFEKYLKSGSGYSFSQKRFWQTPN